MISKYSKKQNVFEYPKNPVYLKLSEFAEGTTFTIKGLFINSKSQYGEQCSMLIQDGETIVNLPKHLVKEVREILNDFETIEQIKSGKAGARVVSYIDRNKNPQNTIEFYDL